MLAPLTLDDVHAMSESALRLGYWSELVAYPPDHSRAFWLGAHPSGSPRLALRWLRSRARDVADQLDPAVTLPMRCWLLDEHEQQQAMSALARGEMYAFTVVDDGVRYVLSARPTRPNPTRVPPV